MSKLDQEVRTIDVTGHNYTLYLRKEQVYIALAAINSYEHANNFEVLKALMANLEVAIKMQAISSSNPAGYKFLESLGNSLTKSMSDFASGVLQNGNPVNEAHISTLNRIRDRISNNLNALRENLSSVSYTSSDNSLESGLARVELTGGPLHTLVSALDQSQRLSMGQFFILSEHDVLREVGTRMAFEYKVQMMSALESFLDDAKFSCFPELKSTHHSHGIHSDKISDNNRISYDLQKVIRHRLAWDSAGNPEKREAHMIGFHYDTPDVSSKTGYPLAEIVSHGAPQAEMKAPKI